MRTAVDSATQRANSTGNHDTAHGFAFIRAVVAFTVSTAATDTNAATITNTTPVSVPHAEPFAHLHPARRAHRSDPLPAPVTRLDRTREPMNEADPQQSRCLPCRKGRCASCQWRKRRTSCSCSCPWLVADVLAHFPSLRRQYLKENR